MTVDERLQRTTDAVKVDGCPICETEPMGITVLNPASIKTYPCGHEFPPTAALDLD